MPRMTPIHVVISMWYHRAFLWKLFSEPVSGLSLFFPFRLLRSGERSRLELTLRLPHGKHQPLHRAGGLGLHGRPGPGELPVWPACRPLQFTPAALWLAGGFG